MAYKIFRFLGSLKMAVIVILAMAVLSAIGTFLESRYNTEFAQVLIYKSPWMYITMAFFLISVVFSAVERLPWKRRHIPFLVAHVGLIMLVFGSYITQQVGLDGTLTIPLDGKASLVSITPKDLSLYASMDGDNFRSLYEKEVEFISNPPSEQGISIPTDQGRIEVVDYFPFAVPERKIIETDKDWDRPGIRFLLKNPNVNFSDWLVLDRPIVRQDLGPVLLIFSQEQDEKYFPKKNTIYFYMEDQQVKVKVFKALNDRAVTKADLNLGKAVEMPWMGMKLSLLNFYPHARRIVEYQKRDYPSGITTSALKVKYRDEFHYLGLNSILKFFNDSTAYILSWGNRQIELGFPVQLKKFEMDKYMGTNRAASYASTVVVPELGEVKISMNEPLKYKGYTFYQASFQQDENGAPNASILSVNKDPGRIWKYLGSLLICVGSVMLFYMRKYYAQKKPKKEELSHE
ncbi:MAG: cytochrome c biogenesis protein ResB [Bdellovibrionota bacterium]|nr:cytochrome c biogenesis protein [Pseudobdellovibrionaceae bacterium]